jgi:signal transduction histidine kinase
VAKETDLASTNDDSAADTPAGATSASIAASPAAAENPDSPSAGLESEESSRLDGEVPTFARVDLTAKGYTALESQHRVLDTATSAPQVVPVRDADLESVASNVLDFVAERRAAARLVSDGPGRDSQTTLQLEPDQASKQNQSELPGAATESVPPLERPPVGISELMARRDARDELKLKTERLLHFRLAFAATGLVLCVGFMSFGKTDLDFVQLTLFTAAVLFYSTAAILLLEQRFIVTLRMTVVLNAILIACDILVVTGLVHETKGLDSDLYVLYLLPILLSSFTFGRLGINAAALFVSISYVTLLLYENANLLPYLLIKKQAAGLAAAYSQQLWRRILARSALLVSVTFIWGRFCQYMSGLERLSTDRLREQLIANNDLIAEMKGQAAREALINSINSQLRSTLDLNRIFETAVDELGKALHASCCAIVCPSAYPNEPPVVCESIIPTGVPGEKIDENLFFGAKVCQFALNHRTVNDEPETDTEAAEVGDDRYDGLKISLYHNPAELPYFEPISDDLSRLNFGSLIIKPMIYGDESKGVILIADLDHSRIWTASDLQLVNTVAGQVSVAIEHAQMVDQLSRKNRDLVQKNLNLDAKNLELRAMQSQLIHQEKMASLGRLVAGIAHELNNPINFVHGNLPYLRNYFDDLKKIVDAFDSLPAEHKSSVDALKKKLKYTFLVTDLDNILADLDDGAERIRHIIRNLKSFSRLDEAELKEASIQEGIESSLKILSQYYGRDKIPARLEFADIPPILCYPGQLNQVWMNLFSNAAQAVESRSEPRVSVKTEMENGKILISVSDNGTGIKPDVQSKIFEPFYTTKPVGQGTGLGLSICHSIIERHGGQIWCESAPGQGTTFRVRLPVYNHPSELRGAEKSSDKPADEVSGLTS